MVYDTMLRVKSLNKEDTTMTKTYIQPAVQVAQFASMTLMQAASPAPAAGDQMPIGARDTDTQW